MSFPRSHRLVTKAEFKQVFDDAFKVSQKYLLILCRPNQKKHARIGVIVGKRFVNSAVDRNRIRRVVRDSFRLNQEKLIGLDIVVIARQQCDTLSKDKIRKGIDDLWERLLTQYQNRSSS
ncbi:MAG: ribonuclease P protein component [Gammaproteobacteria bacterium]